MQSRQVTTCPQVPDMSLLKLSITFFNYSNAKDFQVIPSTTAQLPSGVLSPNFQPTINGKHIFKNHLTLARNSSFVKAPCLMGNNDFEPGFFKLEGATNPKAPASLFTINTL
ncbi:hypothetical protein BDZ45DRAFT_753812 [Acephala macrosclerotiorum]|nr:hypothetical protein BDZ45DRAFT_753812 [Acephala macrosclerotiorum]